MLPRLLPHLAGDDQRVRSFPPNRLILLAPRAGLEPATKRLTVSCSETSYAPAGDTAPDQPTRRNPTGGHLTGDARGQRRPRPAYPYCRRAVFGCQFSDWAGAVANCRHRPAAAATRGATTRGARGGIVCAVQSSTEDWVLALRRPLHTGRGPRRRLIRPYPEYALRRLD